MRRENPRCAAYADAVKPRSCSTRFVKELSRAANVRGLPTTTAMGPHCMSIRTRIPTMAATGAGAIIAI